MKSKQKDINLFVTPFTVEPADVPKNLDHDVTCCEQRESLQRLVVLKTDWPRPGENSCG